ncbi:uncharacterized protein LOC101770487 isoform X2 [Setaria italica]|uniref:uncharacterized protein LOC101770487 isoform X2 n=1 Tax=Setaria italica TaxID=4555 RepID=UPI00064790ED|nr:uncharacterized protein LOC101770487 isoform X2 [Setaria italica]
MDFAGMKRRALQALCKRHGLPAGGTNAALVARLDAALSGAAGAEEEEDVVGVAAKKGCLKRSVGDAGEAKKVTFAVEESRGRGKCHDAGSTDSAADDGFSAEAGANVTVRRSRRNSLTAAEAEEVEAAVTVGRKRKLRSQEIAEDVAVCAQVVVSSRVTRRSSLSGTTVLLPPAVEKKRGRGKAADSKDKLVADAQDSSVAASPAVVESKRSRRKGENCEPDVNKSAKVEVSTRTTRSRSVEAVVMSPTVVENKRRRKTGDAQPDAELPTVPQVPRNDAPVTRSLRNRVVQVNNSVVEETHTSQLLENKMQPSRPATRRHQQVASSVEEEKQEQLAATSKAPPLRRPGKNNSEVSNANSESNKLSSTLVEAKDSKTAQLLTRHNAKDEDVEKQPIVKEPVRRSTRRSVVSAMLDNEKDLFEEKNPEAHVRRSMRKSIVPVKDIKGAGEESQNAKGEDAAKQPAVKEPVRRSTRKSVVSVMHEKEEKDLIAEKNPEAHVRRSKRKSVVPAKDIEGVGEDIQNSKGADVQKQLVVKQPVRRSSRKSALPDMLENESGFLVAETNAEAHVRGSTRKSVLPNMLNKENPDHSKMARNENFEIGKCEDEKQQKVKEPVRRSRRSVATVMLEEQNKGLHEGKMTTIPMRRSTRKSVALNVVEKERTDHTEEVGSEQLGVGATKLKVTDQLTDGAVAVVASGNELQVEVAVQNNQGLQQSTGKSSDHNLSDGNERHPGSDKYASCERVGEEGLKLRKQRSSMEISSSANDSWNAEDFSGPKFRKQQSAQTPSEKDYTGANYDKPLRTQQASNSTSSKGRSSKRRRTTAPEEVMFAEEAKDDMVIREATKDTHKVSNEYSKESSSRIQEICQVNATREEISSSPLLGTVTLPDEICSAQSIHRVIPGSGSGDAAKESSDKSKQPQEHSDIQADDSHLSETRNGEVDQSSSIGELLPHNCFVSEDKPLMGEASESALPTSDSNPEICCDVISEQSVQAADLGRCTSNGGKGNPVLTNLHSDSAADDRILPVLNDGKGCSSDGRHSSLGLEFLFTEVCKESCSRNVENTAVEVDGGNKSSTSVSPGFCVGSDCGLEDEDVQPTGFDADKKLDVDQDVAEEEVVAEEKSYDEHVASKTDLNTKLNGELTGLDMESDCGIAEKNVRLVADNPDEEEATIQVLQGYVQEGDSEKPSQFSATPECKHECGLPEETVLHSKENKGRLSIAEQSPFGLQFLFSKESIEKSVEYGALASATVHMENGFDELKDCHVKCILEKTHASEPFSHHDTDEGSCSVSKSDVCMCTSQQDNGIEGLSKASLDEEWVSSGFLLDANHIKDVTNSEEAACKGEGSKKPAHSDDLKASSGKTDVKGPGDNPYSVTDTVFNSALHAPANDNYDACLDSNTELVQQGHKDRCSEDTEERFASKPWTNDIIEDAIGKYSGTGVVLLPAEERSHVQDGQLNSKLEGAKVLDSGLNFSKDISSILDNGSVVGSIGERTLSSSGLPKDSSIEYNLRQEVLDGSSAETFLDGSNICGGKNVSRVDTIENPSFNLATPGYKHEGALSEEAVRTMKKYAGTCSSNPRELLMDLQALFSKENIEESDSQDGLAFAESPGDESIDVKQQVEVHLGSNLSQFESTHLLDGLIGCSKTEVLHQGHKDGCSEDREEQVASGPCANDIVEAAAARYIESGVVLLPSEETSNLKDGQLNPKKESAIVMESGLNCSKDVTNTSDNGSVVDIVGQRTPSGSGLPEDYRTDHNLQQEFLDGCSVESSLQGSTISSKKIVSGVAGTFGNPSFSLATPNYKHEGALSEEAVCKMKNYTGTCSADPRHLLMELQSLFSEGSIEKIDPHDDLAFPSAGRGRNEPVDTLVCSEPDTNQGICKDLSRAEEKESCMSISVQHYESGGFLRSSHMKDWAMSAQIDLSDDARLIERNTGVEEVLCEEKEKRKSMPTSDSDVLHEKSRSNEHGICRSHGQKHIVEINSKQSSCDSEMIHQDHKEENYEPNEDKILENGMYEDAPVKGIESAIMLPSVAGTLKMPVEQLKTNLGDEGEEHSFSCGQDMIEIFCTGSAKKDLFPLPKDYHVDSFQKQDVPDVLSLLQSPEESANCLEESVTGSGSCQTSGQQCINEVSGMQVTSNIEVFHQGHEESYENNDGKITPGIPASGVSEAVDIERSETEIGLAPPGGTSALPDEQLNMKVESHEVDEYSCCYDEDTSSLFDTESLCSKASSLDKDTHKDPPSDLSTLRSPEVSTVFQNQSVPGSVGICQSSRRRGIDELRAKLQSFKVSSTVKGSYIAMSAPRPKPGDNLGQSAIALLRNRENAPPAKAGHHAMPNPDRSVAKESSRLALQPISGRPRDH